MSRERLFIIDAFAHVFRSYYAIRHIDNNAVYGFTTMLKKLIASEQPEYLVVAFDSPGPSFRHELYEPYKANRQEMPEDLRPQVPLIKEMVEAFNIPMIQVPGFEADDIIGTLAKRAAEDGLQAVIVSPDKDMLQLVSGDDVVMYDSAKGISYLGEAQLPDHFGCKPGQVIDLLSIWGDSSDNVPGVPGVGQKGAIKLLAEYGSLEGIYEHLDEIKRKSYREGFEKARDTIDLTRKLVTIVTDMDLPYDRESFRSQGVDRDKAVALFERLNFRTMMTDLPVKLNRIETSYQLLDSEDRLKEWIDAIEAKGWFVFDVETTSLNPLDAQLVGVALALEPGKAAYVPLAHEGQTDDWQSQAESMLKPLFANPVLKKCAHNAKYDYSVLSALGWQLDGPFDDTMLMSYLLNPNDNRHGLDDLAESHLNYLTIHFEDVCGKGADQVTFDKVPLQQAADYAGEDADICIQLYQLFAPKLKSEHLERAYTEVEQPLVPVLSRMEQAGIRVDVAFLEAMAKDMEDQIGVLESEIYELAGEEFNIKSTKQLGHILFEKLQLPTIKKTTKTKSYSTDQTVLEQLTAKGHALPAKLLDYRMVTKLKSTYVDALPTMVHARTGRVHSSFNQFIAATGRLSSNHPNLQNIPIRTEMGRQVRAAFIPQEDWMLIGADYSQIELRLLAHFSEDETLVQSFRNGEDIHRRTASEVMEVLPDLVTDDMRRAAKSINFGLIYGMGDFRLARELGITRKKAKAYIDTYFEKMPRVLEFRDQVITKAREEGEIRTLFGHRRALPELQSRNKNLQNQGERLAVNTLIQGTAAEVIKLAMINLDRALREQNLAANLLLQVHDELVLECHPDQIDTVAVLLRKTMEQVYQFIVPLTVDVHIAKNWKEAK